MKVLTALENAVGIAGFREHAQKLVDHVDIDVLLWANIGRHQVDFTCLHKADRQKTRSD